MKPIKTSQLCDVLCTVVARGTSGTDRKTDMHTKGTPGPTSPHRHLRVLLAEDNPINQKVAVKMLAKMGYRADVVSNGLEALQAIAADPLRRRPDGLPDAGNGRLRSHPANPHARTRRASQANPYHRHDRPCHARRPRDSALPRAWTTISASRCGRTNWSRSSSAAGRLGFPRTVTQVPILLN